MFYVEWDLRRSWLSQAKNICQTCREEVGTTRYVINRNSNNNNCHTHTHALMAVCHASCELCRTALQMWFHFNYPWREVQTAAATKSLYPSTGLSVMSVCPAVCLAVCHSVFVYGCLRVSFCCRATSLFAALCCSLVATLQSAADNVAYVKFPQFPLLPHTGALTLIHR